MRASEPEIRVDVVVDTTDAGEKVTPPSPGHPVYFVQVTRGYITGGEKPPPPTPAVQRLLARALYDQGYKLATKKSPPSLLLMFWWGYMAPIILNGQNSSQGNFSSGSPGAGGLGSGFTSNQGAGAGEVFGLALHGMLPANVVENHTEMEQLVLGSKFEPDSLQDHPSLRLQAALQATQSARYYVIVSALDYKEAVKKNFLVLWTARMSTELEDHTLDQVLPALVSAGAPQFGRDSHGPQMMSAPVVPMGHVEVGTAVLKPDSPGPKAPAP